MNAKLSLFTSVVLLSGLGMRAQASLLPSGTATTIENFTGDADISGPVALGTTVNDSATVAGSPAAFAPTGTVTYNFYTNATASGAPAFAETLPMGSESSPQGPLPAGSYSYQAIYNGDSNYAPSTGAVEPLTVGLGTPKSAWAGLALLASVGLGEVARRIKSLPSARTQF